MGLMDQVREGAEATSNSAKSVAIQHEAIEAYAASLPLGAARAPELDAATHFSGEPDATLAYVVQLDAINFGSGYFPHVQKRPGLSGYFTVASSLKDWFEAHGALSDQQLLELTQADCTRIFGQPTDGGAVDEL